MVLSVELGPKCWKRKGICVESVGLPLTSVASDVGT